MTLRRLIFVLLVLLLPVVAVLGWRAYEVHSFFSLHRRVLHRIESLERPANIDPERWEEASGWARTAFGNVWPWNPESHDDLQRFTEALDQQAATGDNLATLRWIWDELERTTKGGPRYAANHRPIRLMTLNPITDENLGRLWGLHNCYWLDLSNTEVSDAGLHHLALCQNVRHVYLGNTRVTDAGLAQLPALRLTGISLANCRIGGSGLALSIALGDLTFLDLAGTEITDQELAIVSRFVSLQHLDLERTKVTDSGLALLAGLMQIEVLDLSETQVAGPGLHNLVRLDNLWHLDLGSTPVTGVGLESLRDLRRLKKLDLEKARISSEGLASVAELVQLEDLNLDETDVSDESLEHLAGLRQLTILSLRGTRMTSHGLEHLSRLPRLKHMDLPSHIAGHRDELERLSQAIPNCWIRCGDSRYHRGSRSDP